MDTTGETLATEVTDATEVIETVRDGDMDEENDAAGVYE